MKAAEFDTEVAFLLALHETEPEHTRRVANLALALFRGLDPLHGLGPAEERLLGGAALLHDIGWSRTQPDGRGHHKATAEMIRAHPWVSLSAEETRLMAAVARYHRRSLPAAGQVEWDGIPEDQRNAMQWMAACLRIADGLDRRHLQRVRSLRVENGQGRIRIQATPSEGIGTEIEAARKKADLLERLTGIPVEIVPTTG